MATIRSRTGPEGSKVWQAVIRRKGYPQISKTFKRKADAMGWARKNESEMDAHTWRDTSAAQTLLLGEALERYLSDVSSKKRPQSARRDKASASHLKDSLGRLTISQVTPEKVAAYRDARLKEVSPHSVRIELALLSHLFSTACREWGMDDVINPVSRIKKPVLPEGRCPVLSEAQILRLVEECKRSPARLLYPFVMLALHTGCRSLELRGLRWSQVNLEEGFISLHGAETKGHRSRTIPLTDVARKILEDIAEERKISKVVGMDGQPLGLVFPSRKHPDKPRDLHVAFNHAVKKAGLADLPGTGKLRIHDLRHTCGTYLLMNGADLETVRGLLGHRDLTTTQRYLHVVQEHKRRAIQRIGHLGGEGGERDRLSKENEK